MLTGIVKEKLGGKSYAVYSIQVTEISISGAADDRQWQTTRRYSDFYDLYIIISDKVKIWTSGTLGGIKRKRKPNIERI